MPIQEELENRTVEAMCGYELNTPLRRGDAARNETASVQRRLPTEGNKIVFFFSSFSSASKRSPTMASAPISEHEAALYDRQIRLWGLDAQQR